MCSKSCSVAVFPTHRPCPPPTLPHPMPLWLYMMSVESFGSVADTKCNLMEAHNGARFVAHMAPRYRGIFQLSPILNRSLCTRSPSGTHHAPIAHIRGWMVTPLSVRAGWAAHTHTSMGDGRAISVWPPTHSHAHVSPIMRRAALNIHRPYNNMCSRHKICDKTANTRTPENYILGVGVGCDAIPPQK